MANHPEASRPYMPGYGLKGPAEGTGLLPWSWASTRLASSHDYWLATVWPDGRPHVMPVWGVWIAQGLWFSCSKTSRKARNLAADGRCVLTTDDALQPVIVEGVAELVADLAAIAAFADGVNEKYGTTYGAEFFDPDINASYQFTPSWAFGLTEGDFTGSPTRWVFGP
jgi:PPOX class probable F420-dependent enzyme